MSLVISGTSLTALSALLHAKQGTATSIWHVHIDSGPAPAPADGPPISAHASRDMSLLKYQILGIVLGYLCFIALVGLTLFFIARPSRRAALSPVNLASESRSLQSRSLQMTSAVQVGSKDRRRGVRRMVPHNFLTNGQHNSTLTTSRSIASIDFDHKVIERDRDVMEKDLERLYELVVESEVRAPKRLSMEATGSDISPVQRLRESFSDSYSLLKGSSHALSPRLSVTSEDPCATGWSARHESPHAVDAAFESRAGTASEIESSSEPVLWKLPRLSPITIPSKELFVKKSATASTPTLPFRARDDVRVPLPTKLTLLSPWQGTFRGAPLRSAIWQPGTAGLATPYSPYMPFTPLTPVTPYLESRAERRQRQRETARRAPTMEDEVIEVGEAWQCVG